MIPDSVHTPRQDFVIDEATLLIMPANYIKNDDGIFKTEDIKNKAGEVIGTNIIPLSRTPFDIIEQLKNPDTGELFLKLKFNGEEKIFSAGELASRKGIIKLASFGVNTNETKAAQLCNYIMEIRALNHIPTSHIFDRFGWKDDGSFVLGKKRYTAQGVLPVSISNPTRETEAIHARGIITAWLEAVEGMMKYETQRFKVYVATVPPFLKILGVSNFSLADTGDTTEGKTRTSNLAMSIYGDPFQLEITANTTQVAVERIATVFTDLPIHPDEVQNIKQEVLDAIIYMIGNGMGKMRGRKEGGNDDLARIRTVGIFTSEKSVIHSTSFGGESMRLIETTRGLGVSDLRAVTRFETGVKNNYGLIAPILIEYLIHNQEEIKDIHKDSQKIIESLSGKYAMDQKMAGIAGRLSHTFAAILTAGKVFEKIYAETGAKDTKTKEEIETIVKEYFQKSVSSKENESYMDRGLAHILSWIEANKIRFLTNGYRDRDVNGRPTYNGTIYGSITDDYYHILPSILREELEKNKWDIRRLLDDLKNANYLKYEEGTYQNRASAESTQVRVYSLIREFIDIKAPTTKGKVM